MRTSSNRLKGIADQLSLPTKSSNGQRRWGGHALRVTGAQHLAGLGVELVVIALLARWASAIVLRYAAEAPLVNITDSYKQKIHNFKFQSFIAKMREEMDETKTAAMNLHRDYVTALKEEIELSMTPLVRHSSQHMCLPQQTRRNQP